MKVLFRMIVFACLSVGMTSAPSYADESSAVHSEKKIAAVSKAVKKLIQKKSIAGAVTMVSWKGEIIHLDAQGMRDIKDQAPLQTDTIFRIFSMTKPVTSVAVMILVERGDIRLDEPAETYLPELKGLKVHRKGKPKRKMTVRHLLTHTAGLTYGFFSNTPVDKMYNRNHPLYSASNTQMMEKLTRHPLLFQPGKKWHYSISTDVLGALVERVSGESLGAFFEANIFRPLEMSDTSFYVSSDKIERFSSSYGAHQKTKERYNQSDYLNADRIHSGGGGLVSTAADYMRFCQMLLNKGTRNGKRVLKEKSVREMTRNQLPEGEFTYGYFGFGLGFQIQLYDWGDKGHVGEYSWDGAASTHFWISPKDELIVVALSQRQPYSNRLKQTLRPLIYQAIR